MRLMGNLIAEKLFGRIWRPDVPRDKARLKAFWAPGLPPPPPAFDVDATLKVVPPPRMYDNNVEGDCVMAARANQQTRFLDQEFGLVPNITDDEVESEYLLETGGQDTGLVPDDSLSLWQSQGWTAAGANHKIDAWGRVDATDQLDVQRCISLLCGMQLGLGLPLAWQPAINQGQPWDAPPANADATWQPGSWGGHQIYTVAYDTSGIYVWTWGRKQLITWAGLAYYGAEANEGEAAGVVRMNECQPIDGLNMAGLLADLRAIQDAD